MKPTHHSSFIPLHFRALALILALLLPLGTAPVTLHAATMIWDSDSGTTGAQDGGGNWTFGGTTFFNSTTSTDNQATTNNTTTDIAQFGNGGTGGTVNVSTQSINGLVFGSTTTTGYSLLGSGAGQTLTIGGSGITVNSGAQAVTLGDTNLGIALSTSQTWTNNSANALTVGGIISGNTFGITKAGTGTLILTNTNTYTGTTSVNGGTLQIGNGSTGSISGSSILAMGGGTLSLNNTTSSVNQAFLSTTLNAGASTITAAAAAATTGKITLGTITRNAGSGGTVDFGATGSVVASNANTSSILGAYATFGQTTWAVTNGASAITGLASFSGNQTSGNIDVTATTSGGNTANSLRFNSSSAFRWGGSSFNGNATLTSGGVLVTSAASTSSVLGWAAGGSNPANLIVSNDLIVHQYNTAFTIGGTIVQNSQVIGLTKSGASNSVLTLNGASSFTGDTYINAGTVQLINASEQTGQWGIATSTTGVAATGALANYNGNIFNLGTFQFSSANNQTLSGVISGIGALIKDTGASSILVLTRTNTYTGATTISAGTLQIGAGSTTGKLSTSSAITDTATLAFNRSDTVTQGTDFASAINGAAGAVVQAGTGTLVLNGTNGYTGATTVNAGTLRLDLATGSLNSASTLTLGGGNFTVKGGSGTLSQTVGNVTLTGSSGSAITIDTTSGGATTLTLGNTWTRNVGSTLNITLGASGTLTSSPTTDGSTPGALVKGSGNIAFATVGGTDWAKVSGGNVVAFASGDYNTTFPASSSTSTINYSLTGNGSVTTTETANTLKINTSTTLQSLAISSGQTLTLNAGGLLFVGANDYSITGGSLTGSGGTQKELVVQQFGGGNLTIGSNIVGALTLTKAGTGALTLTGTNSSNGGLVMNGGSLNLNSANTFTGGVTLNAGTLTLGNAGALNSLVSAQNALTFGSTSTGTLSLNGNSVAVTALSTAAGSAGTLNSSNILQNGSSTTDATLTVGSANTSTTFAGIMQDGSTGKFGLTKIGTGTLSLTNASTNTGTTTISAGTLNLVGNGSLAAPVTLNGGILNLMNSSTEIALSRLSDTAAFNSNGGTIYIRSASGGGLNYSEKLGSTNLNAGNTQIFIPTQFGGGTQTLDFGAFAHNNYSTLTFDLTGGVTIKATTSGLAANQFFPWMYWSNGNTVNGFAGTDGSGVLTTGNVNGSGVLTNGTDWTGNQSAPNNSALSTTVTVNTLTLAASTTALTMNSGGKLITNGIYGSNATIVAGTGGGITTPANGTTPTPLYLAAGQNGAFVLGAPFVDNGTTPLVLVLTTSTQAININSTSNTYSGGTVISSPTSYNNFQGTTGAGSVVLGTGATLGATTAFLEVDSGTLNLGSNTVNVGDFRGGFAGTVTGTGSLTIGNGNNGGGNYQGTLTGAGLALIKTGSGTITLSGINTYTGGTTVGAGTLQLSGTATLGNINSTLTVNGGVLDLNGTTTQGVGNLTGSGGTILNNATGTNVTLTIGNNNSTGGNFAGSIADHTSGTGTVALIKTGSGTITLSGTNTFTGGINIIDGGSILAATNASALGTGPIKIGSAAGGTVTGEIQLSNNITITTAGNISFAQSRANFANSGPAQIENLSGNNSLNSTLSIDGSGGPGANILSTAGTLTLTGNLTSTKTDGRVYDFSGSGNTIVSGTIPVGSGTLAVQKDGAGTLTLSNSGNAYTGATTINAGILNAAKFDNVNTNSSIGNGSAGGSAADLVINGGTLQYTGTTATSTNRLFTIGTAGATLDASGTTLGTLSFTGPGSLAFSSSTAPASLTLTGTGTGTTGAGTLASIIGDSGGATPGANITSLTKNNTGTWSLSGTNTYTGTTTVNAGTLQITNASGLGTGPAVVNAGILEIAGVAVTANNLTLNDGASLRGTGTSSFSKSNFPTIGTTTNTAVTLTTAASSDVFTIGTAVRGGVASGTITIGGPGTVVLSSGSTSGYVGKWLMNGASTTVFRLSDVNALGTTASRTIDLRAGTLQLQVSTDSTFAASTTVSGSVGITPSRGSGGAANTHNMGTLSIGSFTLTVNHGNNYSSNNTGSLTFGTTSLTGDATFTLNNVNGLGVGVTTLGAITDNGSARAITKNGSGTLTLGTAATLITAGTSLSIGAGTVNLNNATALGTAVADISNSGALVLGASQSLRALTGSGTVDLGSNTLTLNNTTTTPNISGVISGASGALTLSGSGTTTLSGASANTYGGLTTVGAGELDLNKTSGVAIAGNLTVSGGIAKLLAASQINTASSLIVSSGTFNIQGFNQTLAGVQLTGGSITGSGGTLTSTTAFDMQSGSVSAILGGGVAFNKTTGGTVTLSGTNTYSGLTTVSGGILQEGINNALASGDLTLSGGTFDINNKTDTIGVITFSGSGTFIGTGGGTLTGTSVSITGSANSLSSGTIVGNATQATSSVFVVNGTLTGSDALGASATLSGTGTVGAVTLAGNNTVSSSGTLTTSGITVSGTGNLIGTGTVTGAITQNASSALTVSGAAGSDSLGTSATLTGSGSGSVGAVTLAGSNTLTGPLTTTGITVNSTGNTIAGTVTGAITQNASSALTVSGAAGSDSLGASATLTGSGSGSVGAVSLAGSNTLTGPLTTTGITVNSTGNTIAGTVTGAITQNASSALTVSGAAGSDSLGASATLTGSGSGSVGAVSLAGSNTLTGPLTTTGITVNSTGNTIAGTVTGAIVQNASSALTVSGAAGSDSLGASATLTGSGSGSVGAVSLAGSNTLTGPLTTTGITVNSTGNTIAGTVTGAITQNASSALNVTGAAGSDALASGATLTGTGSVGAVTLAGNNTLSSSGTLTTSGITVSGTGNTLSSGTVAGNTTLTSGAALAINGALTGTLDIGNGTLTGASGSVSGAATLNGGIINLTSGTFGSTLGVTGGAWNGAGSVSGAVTSSSGTFTIGSGANLTASGGLNVTGGSITAGNSASTITGSVNYTSSTSSTFAGVIAGSTKTLTMNNSAATLNLSNTNTYSGATLVSAGTLHVSGAGTINSTSGLTINGSTANFKYNSSTPYSGGAITFTQGTISGTGTINKAVTVGTNAILSPGNSPGTQAYTAGLTWNNGGTYTWEVNDWTNTNAGTAFDQLQISGAALNISSLTSGTFPAQTFKIAINGLTAGNILGSVPNFDNTISRFWDIATYSSLTGAFDPAKFSLDTSNFSNTLAGGTFSLSDTGSAIRLSFAPGTIATAYWSGTTNGDWGTTTNWNTIATSGVAVGVLPSSATDVHFSTTSPTPGTLAVTLAADYAVKTLTFDSGSGAVTIGGSKTLTITPSVSTDGILVNSTVDDSILSTKVALGLDQTWNVVNSGRTLTVSGVISGAFGLTKTGLGDLVLGATNTYTGATNINGGAIKITDMRNLGDSSQSTNTVGINNGTLNLTAGTVNLGTSRAVVLGASGGTLQTTGTGTSLTVSGVISGAGDLTKTGTGGLTLSNTNTYTGKNIVKEGTLSFSAGDASATADQQLGKNAALDLGVAGVSSGTLLYTGGTGTLAKAINALGNGLDTIQNSGSGLLTLSGVITKNGTTLTLKGGANGIDITGGITGTSVHSDLIIDGGPTTLSVANTYNGPTSIINGAFLNANVANALPTSPSRTAVFIDQTVGAVNTGSGTSSLVLGADQSVASLSGASTSMVNLRPSGTPYTLTIGTTSGSTIFAGVISGTGGSVIKDGASTQIFTGSNTYTGATTVSGGTLQVSSGGSIAIGSAVTASSALNAFSTTTKTSGWNANNVLVSNQTVVTGAPVIAGAGTISGDLTIGADNTHVGVIKPGDSLGASDGTLTIGGNLVVHDGSQLQLGLTSTTQNDAAFKAYWNPNAGLTAETYLHNVVTLDDYNNLWKTAQGGYDSITVGGTLTLGTGGTNYPTILASVNGSFTPTSVNLGDIYKLLNWNGVQFHENIGAGYAPIGGGYSLTGDLVLPGLSAGYTWDTSALGSFGVVVVIPEPGRMMLMFFGLAALFMRRRRNR